jgi:hypothetical protein
VNACSIPAAASAALVVWQPVSSEICCPAVASACVLLVAFFDYAVITQCSTTAALLLHMFVAARSNGNTDTATVKLVFSPNDPSAATPVDDRYTWSGTSFSVNAARGVMANDIKGNCTNGGTHTTTLASSSSRGNVAM